MSCIEEIAFRLGYIDSEALVALASKYLKNDYGQYLMELAREANAS